MKLFRILPILFAATLAPTPYSPAFSGLRPLSWAMSSTSSVTAQGWNSLEDALRKSESPFMQSWASIILSPADRHLPPAPAPLDAMSGRPEHLSQQETSHDAQVFIRALTPLLQTLGVQLDSQATSQRRPLLTMVLTAIGVLSLSFILWARVSHCARLRLPSVIDALNTAVLNVPKLPVGLDPALVPQEDHLRDPPATPGREPDETIQPPVQGPQARPRDYMARVVEERIHAACDLRLAEQKYCRTEQELHRKRRALQLEAQHTRPPTVVQYANLAKLERECRDVEAALEVAAKCLDDMRSTAEEAAKGLRGAWANINELADQEITAARREREQGTAAARREHEQRMALRPLKTVENVRVKPAAVMSGQGEHGEKEN
ncbi:hypothetical protein FB451DRAFT_1444368 [Mycena latifolia]|nr:hypothetical protein FB451DRAFT_1444368 [Mycena latifolia]